MWRAWIAARMMACAPGSDPGAASGARLYKDDAATDGVIDPDVTYWCADGACKTLWVTVEPPRDDVVWVVDGGEPVTADGVVVDTSDAWLKISASTADGWSSFAQVHGTYTEFDTNVVVLGVTNNSCAEFRITTLGGCFSGPMVKHEGTRVGGGMTTALSPAVYTFATNSQQLGFGYAARWRTGWAGALPQGVSSTTDATNHVLWFSVPAGQYVDPRTIHSGLDGVPLPRASCVTGQPTIGTL